MALAEDMNNTVDNILFSYDDRIKSIGNIFETTHQVLQGFRDSLLDTKQEREILNKELQETLARNESLRKKDFNNMMKGILTTQNEREQEVRTLLNSYINEQKEIAEELKSSFDKLKTLISNNEAVRANDFRDMMKDLLAKQDRRREHVTSRLKEFQEEQKETAIRLNELLSKGRELRTRNLKSMLNEFKEKEKVRMSRKIERRKEVESMLGGFNNERREAARQWQTLQEKMKQRRAVI